MDGTRTTQWFQNALEYPSLWNNQKQPCTEFIWSVYPSSSLASWNMLKPIVEIPLEPKVIVKSMMETWHGTKYHTDHGGVVICGDLSIDKNGVGYCRVVKGSGIQRNLADAICALIPPWSKKLMAPLGHFR